MQTLLADAQNLLSNLITRYSSSVDYLMIRLEEAEGTDILLRGDKVETLSEGITIGGQIRACYKGGWGFSSFNQLSTIRDRIEEAITAARIVGDEETILAPIDIVQDICNLPLTGTNPRQIPLKEKKELSEIATRTCSEVLTDALPPLQCVMLTALKESLLRLVKKPTSSNPG